MPHHIRCLTWRNLIASLAAVLVFLPQVAVTSASAAVPAGDQMVYDATITPVPPNLPSLGFQATQTAEFGDEVILGGTNRVLHSATVTMSDWAKHSSYPAMDPSSWTHPVTFSVYAVDHSAATPGVGALIGSATQTITVPWRPETSAACPDDSWTPTGAQPCYHGKAFNATFDLSTLGTVPSEIIYGVSYNTQTWGAHPLLVPGPYNSLNVGLRDVAANGPVPVGTDVESDAVFWNTQTAGNYADSGTGGVGVFRRDTNWRPYTSAVSITASATGCLFSTSGSTLTLQNDCTTDQTILVPDGATLDGAGHTITAVDPTGGHFLGAVVSNAATTFPITVKNLGVTASGLSDACDAGLDRLRGILFEGVGGAITNDTVTHINQGASGCQEGNAIDVENPVGGAVTVSITNNTVSDYQKTGIRASGSVAATITANSVTGLGPVPYIAQNGIQISYGASATATSNTASNNYYTGATYVSCGVLLYKAGGVKLTSTTYVGNQKNLCNYGKGGGSVKPSL